MDPQPSYVSTPFPGVGLLESEVVPSVADVEVDWTALRHPAGLYGSRAWAQTSELRAPEATRYVVARGAGGEAAGVLPLFLVDPAEAGIYDPAATLGAELHAELGRGLVLLACTMAGYRSGFAVRRTAAGDAATAAVASMLLAADAVATELGADVLGVQYLLPAEAELLAATGVVTRAELVFQACELTIDLVGHGFPDYVQALSARRRSTVRRDLALFEASGASVTRSRLSGSLEFGPRLLGNVYGRHEEGLGEDAARELLAAQAACLDGVSHAFAALDAGGAPIAFSVAFEWDGALYVRLVGMEYGRAEPTGAYFQVAYYAPLRLAYERGFSRVHLGLKSYRPKVLRGSRPDPLFGVFRGRGRKRIAPGDAQAVGARKAASVRDELGELAPPWLTGAPLPGTSRADATAPAPA